MKRKISSFTYELFKKELLYLEEIGELLPGQAVKLLQQYEIIGKRTGQSTKVNLNFIQIISIIGAVLIGLGVLSFVASNWSAMSDMPKFALLLFTLSLSYVVAWWLEERKPNLSKALYYIGAFIYGAEIFYIGQLFHLGGQIGTALMAWAFGIIPLAIYKKDNILYGAGFGLFYLSIELNFLLTNNVTPSLWMFLILPLLFVLVHFIKVFNRYLLIANFVLLYQFVEMRFMFENEALWGWIAPIIIGLFLINKFVYPKEKYLLLLNFILLYQFAEMTLFIKAIDSIFFVLLFGSLVAILFVIGHVFMNKSVNLFPINIILAIQFLMLILYHMNIEVLAPYFFTVFAVGIAFTHYRIKGYEEVMKWMGHSFQLIAGVLLTLQFSYVGNTDFSFWIMFGIGYMVYGMFLVYKHQLFGVLIVSLLILRFYVDLSLVFMNKSIAFTLGGILLLGLAYWFEKTRRGEGK